MPRKWQEHLNTKTMYHPNFPDMPYEKLNLKKGKDIATQDHWQKSRDTNSNNENHIANAIEKPLFFIYEKYQIS